MRWICPEDEQKRRLIWERQACSTDAAPKTSESICLCGNVPMRYRRNVKDKQKCMSFCVIPVNLGNDEQKCR